MTDGAKSLILVVDDMPEIGHVLKMYLEEAGYEIIVALDGLEALALVKLRMPDLAICDVSLPSMLGWELCQRLKELSAPNPIPVIMLTAKATELDEMRSFESSADAHFSKPPDFKALVAAVGKHLAAVGKR